MKIRVISFLIMALTALVLAACGGGGGGGSSATVVSGVVSKGPITGATVVVYAVTGGAKGAELGRFTPTPASGAYSVNIGSYVGPVLVESTGGTYTDEATGTAGVSVGVVLRAFADNAAGAVNVAVTPLTEMAAVNIGTSGITPAIIKAQNAAIANTFGVSDIIGVLPGTTGAALDYTLALATFSKYMQTKTLSLSQTLAALGAANPSAAVLSDLAIARSAFIGSAQNTTGVTGNTAATSITVKLSTKGTLAVANSIGGVELTLNLPVGVSIANTAGDAAASVAASGEAVTGSTVGANFVDATPDTVKVIVVKQPVGFGIGEFATVTLTKTAGSVVTPAHIVVTGFKAVNGVVDVNGNLGDALAGVEHSFTATFQ
jgi:hypothetical protein